MDLQNSFVVPADIDTAWKTLLDVEAIAPCMPGATLETVDGDAFTGSVKVKLGPVKATFKGKVELVDLDPPNGYRIQGEGEGGIAGFAKGGAKVTLSEAEGGQTLLRYDVEAQVGGKLMQMGSRLIDSVSKKLADEFFANFAKAVSEG